jgi:ABC-type multidrug transport system ATPase subunit
MVTDAFGEGGGGELLAIEGLSLEMGGRHLIDGLALRVEKGKRTGITGPSGCGKTTLIRSIVKRQLGDGAKAARFEVTKAPVGYLPQAGGLLPWFSLERNLSVFAMGGGADEPAWCAGLLQRLELDEVRDSFPDQLSGGELQRARLACAVASRAALCCADEPLTEVGLQQRWRVLRWWSTEMKARRTGLVLVSHDVDTLMYLCDEIIVLGGSGSAPARVVARVEVNEEGHPRGFIGVTEGRYEGARRTVIQALCSEADYDWPPTSEGLGRSGESRPAL